jgi:NitT/TauT family transport system substrate-binding protein
VPAPARREGEEIVAIGIGGVNQKRLADMVQAVVTAFDLKTTPNPEAFFTSTFLPPQADRMVFPKK